MADNNPLKIRLRSVQTLLTCADSDCLHKLFPPGVRADHQSQVGLFNELVNGALRMRRHDTLC